MELAKECEACGKIFEPTCHITRQKYCSEACRIRYNNARGISVGKLIHAWNAVCMLSKAKDAGEVGDIEAAGKGKN